MWARRFGNRLLAFLLLLSLPTCTRPQNANRPARAERFALRAARMLDVASGQVVNGAVILVEGDKVSAAGTNLQVTRDAKVYDLGDVTVLPGLIDAHTHITYHFDPSGHFGLQGDAGPEVTLRYAEQNARDTLQGGVTTIRNLGAGGRVDLVLRDKINRGETEGPRMVVSGEPLTSDDIAGVYDDRGARLSRVREFVRARAREGVDVIKIFEGVDETGQAVFSEAEIRAAVEEAQRAGLRVAVHAH